MREATIILYAADITRLPIFVGFLSLVFACREYRVGHISARSSIIIIYALAHGVRLPQQHIRDDISFSAHGHAAFSPRRRHARRALLPSSRTPATTVLSVLVLL